MHWVSKIKNEQIVPEPGMIVSLVGYGCHYMLVNDSLKGRWGVVEQNGLGWLRIELAIDVLLAFLNVHEAKLVSRR